MLHFLPLGDYKMQAACGVFRFGVFEVDLRTGELRKQGLKLRLPRQSFAVLSLLLERPGELVTREELREKLWPVDTFVDFDHGLNAAVNRLREVLGDSAEAPRFIETLPRRGYRFIAEVQPNDHGRSRDREVIDLIPTLPPRPPSKLSRHVAAALAVVGIVGAVLAVWQQHPYPPPKVLRYTRLTNDGAAKTIWQFPAPLISDGLRVYFGESDATQRFGIAQVSVDGGEVSFLHVPFEFATILDISKDRSQLLVNAGPSSSQKDFALWTIPIAGGAPQRVGSLLAHAATWAPDGGSLVYAQGRDLYIAKADGSESRKLTSLASSVWGLHWSPDGRVLRFEVWDDSTWLSSLWEISSDDSQPHPLFPQRSGRDECCGDWTPDGKYFVFQSTEHGVTNIWIRRESTGRIHRATEPVQLTSGTMSLTEPAFSPDGKRLFVVGAQPRGELMRYDRKSRQFVTFLGGISAEGLDFSKDGLWATYASFPDCTLWRSRADGTDRLQLTGADMRVSVPRWSPDGKWIAFSGSKAGGAWKIYRVAAEGGSPEVLADSYSAVIDPNWSPDGKSLVFGQLLWPTNDESIYVLDLDTHRVSKLPGSGGMYSPRWSHDGRFISAMTEDSRKLLLFDVATHEWKTLSENRFHAYPSWSQDSQYIYFSSAYEKGTPFYRLRIKDHTLEKVIDVKVARGLAAGLFGAWTGLGPDDSPMFLRDTSLQEVYALDWQLP